MFNVNTIPATNRVRIQPAVKPMPSIGQIQKAMNKYPSALAPKVAPVIPELTDAQGFVMMRGKTFTVINDQFVHPVHGYGNTNTDKMPTCTTLIKWDDDKQEMNARIYYKGCKPGTKVKGDVTYEQGVIGASKTKTPEGTAVILHTYSTQQDGSIIYSDIHIISDLPSIVGEQYADFTVREIGSTDKAAMTFSMNNQVEAVSLSQDAQVNINDEISMKLELMLEAKLNEMLSRKVGS